MRIVIAGDSTASDYDPELAPRTGWGQALSAHPELKTRTDLEIRNHALSGASTRSFIEAGLLDSAASDLEAGDVLLICFGHNDPKHDHRFADADTAFVSNLRRFVAAARDRGATPVLLTPIERRKFTDDGSLYSTHSVYPDRARAVAREEAVALIDLTALTHTLWQSQGAEPSKASFLWFEPGEWPGHPDGAADDTHLSASGAHLVADLVRDALDAHDLLPVQAGSGE